MALPASFDEALEEGLAALGLGIDAGARGRLSAYAERLLAWNRKVNLTSVTDPASVAELHLVDSLSLLRTLGGARTLLDIGSGAGIPGAVLACARSDLAVTCCDGVQKKVSFVKAIAAELGLAARAFVVRAAGEPEAEGLGHHDAVVSRAVADPARWLPLGMRYLTADGKLFAMLGRASEESALEALAKKTGLRLEAVDRFILPRSGAQRAVARFGRE